MPLEREKLSFARQTSKKHPALSKGVCFPVLKLPFVTVYSERLGETMFFCQDETTKGALMEAAEPWSIYTLNELQVLLAQNRIKPLTQADLRKVHQIKRTFGARITE